MPASTQGRLSTSVRDRLDTGIPTLFLTRNSTDYAMFSNEANFGKHQNRNFFAESAQLHPARSLASEQQYGAQEHRARSSSTSAGNAGPQAFSRRRPERSPSGRAATIKPVSMPFTTDRTAALAALVWTLISVTLLTVGVPAVAANFLPRDFVESSIRVHLQTSGSPRTNASDWMQIEGSKAPIFGAEKHALVSIPREADSVQFAFDHQRLVTEWLKLSGRVRNPVVLVTMTRTGSALNGVHAAVHEYKKGTPFGAAGGVEIHERAMFMDKLFQEFHAGSGGKRVLVKYVWRNRHDRDVGMANLVLVGVGVVVSMLMGFKTWLAYRSELSQFYTDVSGNVGVEPPAPMATASSGHLRQPGQVQQRTAGLWQQHGGGKAD